MKKILITLLLVLVGPALVAAQILPEQAPSEQDTCDASIYAEFVGQSSELIDTEGGFYFQNPYNIIEHGQFVDSEVADLAMNRKDIIYVMLDENGNIASLTCTAPIQN